MVIVSFKVTDIHRVRARRGKAKKPRFILRHTLALVCMYIPHAGVYICDIKQQLTGSVLTLPRP